MRYTAVLNKRCLRGKDLRLQGSALYISDASFWVDGVVSVRIPRDKSSLVSEEKKIKPLLWDLQREQQDNGKEKQTQQPWVVSG